MTKKVSFQKKNSKWPISRRIFLLPTPMFRRRRRLSDADDLRLQDVDVDVDVRKNNLKSPTPDTFSSTGILRIGGQPICLATKRSWVQSLLSNLFSLEPQIEINLRKQIPRTLPSKLLLSRLQQSIQKDKCMNSFTNAQSFRICLWKFKFQPMHFLAILVYGQNLVIWLREHKRGKELNEPKIR